MTTVKLFHAHEMNPAGPFSHVATITVEGDVSDGAALDYTYAATQNLRGSWSRGSFFEDAPNLDFNPAIERLAPLPKLNGVTYGLRSTSIGDRMEIDGRLYVVASFGFEPVSQAPAKVIHSSLH